MKMKSLHDLYVEQLKDLYNAETQITKALPKMAKAASSPQLQQAYHQHMDQTKGQMDRLKQIFEELGKSPTGKKCVGMEGIIKEGDELLDGNVDPDVLDAGLIGAAQKVEHYEICGYGTARTYAQRLGYDKAARVLQQILDEEKQTDAKLTALAESGINVQAKNQ
ncbi:MAG TPA: ferritin-like domain-containing protein [Anaerolineaceae bacterium]|jgi:ferritin-like metal-binding protein YciE|nr:ferritin-like domain-containing protein [Anaerolineaceae bacterium]